MIIVAVKLFFILMQVGCSDKIIYPISSFLFIILVLSLNKNIYVRKQNDNVMRREGGDSFTVLAFENVCKNFV
jgi:hypothetical protein